MQKLAIITGGNAGLGKQTAIRLAQQGFDLVIACRNHSSGAKTANEIHKLFPETNIEVRTLDLADLDSVRAFAIQQKSHWHLLVNNAGAKIEIPRKFTKQGFEWHVGVNHLGHFALTADLWESAASDARVVSVSSIVARQGKLDLKPVSEEFNASIQYANSKLMNLAFAMMLAQKLENSRRSSTAAHPGFARANPYGNWRIRIAEYLFAQSAKSGSKPLFDACHSSNGTYLAPEYLELWGNPKPIQAQLPSISELENFWSMSESLTRRKFKI